MINKTLKTGLKLATIFSVATLASTSQAQVSITNANQSLVLTFNAGAISLTTVATTTPASQVLLSPNSHFLLRVTNLPSAAINGITVFDAKQTYLVGDTTSNAAGSWVVTPTLSGNQIVAEWVTGYTTYTSTTGGSGTGGTGGTATTVVFDPNIHVKISMSFVGDIARFEFIVFNTSTSPQIFDAALVEDIVGDPTGAGGPDGPLRLDNQPYLYNEALLVGSQIPNTYEHFATISAATATANANIFSVKGIVKPTTSTQTEPTPPIKFAFGRASQLTAARVWDFVPNTSIDLGRTKTNNNASIVLYYSSGQTLPPTPAGLANGANKDIIAYVGQAGNSGDYSQPLALQVTGPTALGYKSNAATPNPFKISAVVANLTNLNSSSSVQFNTGQVTATLQLPTGLQLATGETLSKTIPNIAPGSEANVSWQVQPNGAATGILTYSVAAGASNAGFSGKSVQRNIEVPAPATLVLKGKDAAGIKYRMVSFPLDTSNVTANQLLGLTDSDYEIVKYDPSVTAGTSPYSTVRLTTGGIKPGVGYWIYSRLNVDKSLSLDTSIAKPISGQVQPLDTGVTQPSPVFARGWGIIGNPYIYGIRFSEINLIDTTAKASLTVSDAADPVNGWISSAVWKWDTSDPDSTNWHYVLQDNLGFTLNPYDAYWIYVRKANLTFAFPGVDVAGASVTRAANVLGAKTLLGQGKQNNWRLQLTAKGASGLDTATYIGVAPRATDNLDNYKYEKPPVVDSRLSLELVNSDYDGGKSRYAQDLRSPSLTKKTWNLVVRSGKPNEDVTLSWADIAASVPRDYTLTLVDNASNSRTLMRTRASVTVNTGTDGTRSLTIEATPTRGAGRVRITTFDVVDSTTRAAGVPASVTIQYATSQAAETRIVIRDSRGRTIRTLISNTRAAEAGTGSVVWDMKNGQGSGVAAGLYNVEVLAVGTDGQTDRQTRPYIVTR